MQILHMETVRELMPYKEKEIEEVLGETWHIGDEWRSFFSGEPVWVEGPDIMARAITWGEKGHPNSTWKTALFATMVEGFSTGLFGGFGQDQEPLYELAEEVMIAASHVCPPPVSDTDDHRKFTKLAFKLLEELIWGNPDDDLRYRLIVGRLVNELCHDDAKKERVEDKLFRLRAVKV